MGSNDYNISATFELSGITQSIDKRNWPGTLMRVITPNAFDEDLGIIEDEIYIVLSHPKKIYSAYEFSDVLQQYVFVSGVVRLWTHAFIKLQSTISCS